MLKLYFKSIFMLICSMLVFEGNVVALHGKETGGGDFFVEDVLEAGLPPQLDHLNKSGIIRTSYQFTRLIKL